MILAANEGVSSTLTFIFKNFFSVEIKNLEFRVMLSFNDLNDRQHRAFSDISFKLIVTTSSRADNPTQDLQIMGIFLKHRPIIYWFPFEGLEYQIYYLSL
ncbi:MAG: hypothetical protein R2827_14785 [Bdellovibrionales bacterium]